MKSCGPLYQEALAAYTAYEPDNVRLFAAGFVHGQAEKVYLGACNAAMFRPSEERWAMVERLVAEAASRYRLKVVVIATDRGRELWLCRSEATVSVVEGMPTVPTNTARWHRVRGLLCGVPACEIDADFHSRDGHNDPCDIQFQGREQRNR